MEDQTAQKHAQGSMRAGSRRRRSRRAQGDRVDEVTVTFRREPGDVNNVNSKRVEFNGYCDNAIASFQASENFRMRIEITVSEYLICSSTVTAGHESIARALYEVKRDAERHSAYWLHRSRLNYLTVDTVDQLFRQARLTPKLVGTAYKIHCICLIDCSNKVFGTIRVEPFAIGTLLESIPLDPKPVWAGAALVAEYLLRVSEG